MVFEAQTEIYGQRRGQPPVILYKPSENIAPKLGGGTQLAAGIPLRSRSSRNAAQPEISQAGACCSRKIKIAQGTIISWIDVILALAHELEAGLDLVPAPSVDQVVFELALGRVEYLDQIAKSKTCSSAVITRDIQFNQAGRLNVAAEDAQLLTYVPQ
jgi:hypothetical protein